MKVEKVNNNQLTVMFHNLLKEVLVLVFSSHFLLISFYSNSQSAGVLINTNPSAKEIFANLEMKNTYCTTGIISNPGSISGIATVCQNATGIGYSIALVPGATGYNWTVPSGGTITTGQGSASITVNYGTSGGNICVTAENACSTSSTSCLAITVSACIFSCGGTLTDIRDGQTYSTVQIGTQCWTSQNLNYGTYVNIHSSPQLPGEKFCQNTSGSGAGNNNSSCPMGGLYEWALAMNISSTYDNTYATPTPFTTSQETCNPCSGISGVQGICPNGWHIPTDAESITLTTFLNTSTYLCGGSTQIAKSMASTSDWNSSVGSCAVGNNESANNLSGFNGFPGGYSYNNSFGDAGHLTYWWTSTDHWGDDAWDMSLNYNAAIVNWYNSTKMHGLSVRCIQD